LEAVRKLRPKQNHLGSVILRELRLQRIALPGSIHQEKKIARFQLVDSLPESAE
jgi:hypothetical protein